MNKVPVVRAMSWEQVAGIAEALLSQRQPDALVGHEPVDIDWIFEFVVPEVLGQQGISFKTGSAELKHGLLGHTDAAQGFSYVSSDLYDAEYEPEVRRGRATMAHESGHCLLHVPVMRQFMSLTDEGSGYALYRALPSQLKPFEDPERQAWKFAGALLMPRPAIFRFLEQGKNIRWMADFFGVNPVFMEVRMSCKTLKS